MAEAHIGTAFGAIGALDTLVQRCMQGFSFWQRIENFTESVEMFKTRMDWQRSKLSYWALEWHIDQHTPIDPRFRTYEGAIVNYLNLIYRIIHELGSLGGVFPTLAETHNLTSMTPFARLARLADQSSTEFGNSDPADSTSTGFGFAPERLKWALQDERANQSLELLSTLIKDLYEFLPPPKPDLAATVVLGTSLASQDADTLMRISRASVTPRLLAEFAWLKSITYSTQTQSQMVASRLSPLDKSKLVPIGDSTKSRFLATYDGYPVFVEQKHAEIRRDDRLSREVLEARIENIVCRLQHPHKPMELRTLPCQGMIIERSLSENSLKSTFKIIYRVDESRYFSLRDILRKRGKSAQQLRDDKDSLQLGQRYRIAQLLARAVMCLHLVDWLHKAIKSENVLFFADDITAVGSAMPFLVGFEYSRPDAQGEQTENVVDGEESRFYRHPQAQAVPVADVLQPLGGAGRYSKVYDIYSVGVILVELGLFKSAQNIILGNRCSLNAPAEEIRRVLIEKAIPEVKFCMGEIYANAARICLDGYFDKFDRQSLDTAFYTHVVRRLELCNA
ncbi:uncharacterized protein PAC_15970 [Phialocephala subalpina]|uniref:Protein kinase domain-containing protein n=1 Tax=Phialocephala subalpina TaxID=576137 RepID=A0A1L7XM10_9HELO|nr:uncharacterized protein PAC_15970 [Phialocephala subalpina]